MRSQSSNRQKLNSVKNQLADYIKKVEATDLILEENIVKGLPFADQKHQEFHKQYYNDGKMIIRRQELTLYFSQNYNSINSITTWINKLLALNILSLNPDSSLSAKKRIYKPTPDSRYYINEENLFGRDIPLSNFG
jgi:hypothetical protein